eukprot:TRINITY_DN9422_c0_g1_i1.p1 TRINITY_DN9422_c0_g1~~TRINITY_DN9422_c0_g1_i1.p1  ORF type:complete len:164 (+),score=19.84 TRINITY_DN9422_c0_g1_i1:106-597(+)
MIEPRENVPSGMDMCGKIDPELVITSNNDLPDAAWELARKFNYPISDKNANMFLFNENSIVLSVPFNQSQVTLEYLNEHKAFLNLDNIFAFGYSGDEPLLLTEKGFYLEHNGCYEYLGDTWQKLTETLNSDHTPTYFYSPAWTELESIIDDCVWNHLGCLQVE